MIIDIEVIIFGIILTIVITWFIWYKLSKWWNARRYNPENDKGRKAEERRREDKRIGTTGREPAAADIGIKGLRESEKRTVLQAAKTIADGKTSDSNGKVSRKFPNFFRRK